MKKILPLLLVIFTYYTSMSQCSVRQIPLSNRAANSSLIIEGKVINKHSYWNDLHNMIYTTNVVEVYKIFKGNLTSTSIEIITVGGIVGLDKITADPSLSLNVGEIGIFTCEGVTRFDVPVANRSSLPRFEAYASVQGFVKYDLAAQTASDPFHTYRDIETELYDVLLSPALNTWVTVAPFNIHTNGTASQKNGQPLQIQSISGFAPTTVNAGTGDVITITGSGFGSTQGAGSVSFRNADDGGATVIQPLESQYISWSNTQIVVEVPQNAGTGTIRVTQGATQTSSGVLTVNFAHLNVDFDPGPGTIAYQTDHISDNGSGGYTWRMNNSFSANTAANASFMRAFNEWRCNTGVNWTIGSNTSVDDAVSDGTNIICFDNVAPLAPGILGVCYSYWSGCASGPTIIWYVNELDIIFDEGSNITPLVWEYGTATPSGNEYDFETVAVHELGHGHQLGHVINPGAIMHFEIANGTSNRSLGVNDLAGGNFVQAKSIVTNVCGPGAMTNHSCGTAPVADFSGSPTTICAGATVSFTDLSTNIPTSWSWSFPGGSPSSSTLQNPTITYNAPGVYAVTLTATNVFGSDVKTINGYITVNDVPSVPGSISGPTSICVGSTNNYSVTADAGVTYNWSKPSGWSGTSSTNNISATAGATSGNMSVTATNGCGTSAASSLSVTVNNLPTISITGPSTVCSGSSATLTANGGNSYNWNTGASTAAIVVSPSGTTTYSVTGTDLNGCVNTASLSLSAITCSGIPSTSLQSVYCSTTLTTLSDRLKCHLVSGAAKYEWQVTDISSGTPYLIQSANNLTDMYLSYIPQVTYSKSYSIRVRAYVGGMWGTFGSACSVTTPAFAATKLQTVYCSTTLTTLSDRLKCDIVPNTTKYEWEITDIASGTPYLIQSTGNTNNVDMYLSYVPQVTYNKSYSIRVRAYSAGIWGAFGTACTVTTPASAITKLQSVYCSTTLSTLNDKLKCDLVPSTTKYEWQVTDISSGAVYLKQSAGNSNNIDMYLSYIPQVTYNKSYSIRVRAYSAGVWGNFGTACTVTTPASGARIAYFETETTEIENAIRVNTYPNPVTEFLNVDFDATPENASVEVYNMVGELVLVQSLTDINNTINTSSLTNGLYFTKIIINNKLMSAQKIVKQ